MKNIKLYALLAGVMFTTYSCNKDEISSESIFVDAPESAKSDFDNWIWDNFTKPYNITLDYYYKDNETDIEYNVTPPSTDKSLALAKLMKHVWIDAYTEVAGENFLKENCFRKFVFVGSPEYTDQGKIKLGQAEGGIKVTLFRVNELNPDKIYINSDNFYRDHYTTPLDLNYWYFHTMHHEFCHILTQKKVYTTEYRGISEGDYSGPDWNNISDEEAAARGFVSGYSTKEYNEDFAEMYSTYVTSSDKAWNQILEKATKLLTDTNGTPIYELDKLGKPIVETDAKGNPLYELDEKGNRIPETDVNGNKLYKYETVIEKDEEGNIVFLTDESGNPVYLTTSAGKYIPMYEEQVEGGISYKIENGKAMAYFNYGGTQYPVTATAQSFHLMVEKDAEGNPLLDAEGKQIPMYYPAPKTKTGLTVSYKYKYVQMKDEKAKKKILAKLELVRAYFKNNWKIDIDELRAKILEKSSEESLKSLNLKSAK